MKQHILKTNKRGNAVITTTLDPEHEAFIKEGQGIYGWCEAHRLPEVLKGDISVIKVGQYGSQGDGNKLPQDTIKSYSGATTQARVIVYVKRMSSAEIAKFRDAYSLEQTWKSSHKGKAINEGSSTEAFEVSLQEIITFFSEALYGQAKNLNNHGLRPSQQKAVNKMESARLAGHKDFLLGAVMRFGKNFTFLHDCLNHVPANGNVLVFSNKPTVFASLRSDITSHSAFTGMTYSELKDDRQWQTSSDKINVLAISKQLWDKNTQWISDLVKSTDFHAAFLDECHSGTNTETFQVNTLPFIKSIGFRVFASGTPFKTIASGDFTPANTYFYDYVDQQNDKKAGLIKAVSLKTYVPKIDPAVLAEMADSGYSEDEGFNFTKFFGCDEEGRLIKSKAVKKFINTVLAEDAMAQSIYSPYASNSDINHSIWLLDRTNSVMAISDIINQTDEYRAIPATAGHNNTIGEVSQKISEFEAEGYKTITLTVGRFVEGSTEPRWNAAFLMSNTSSIERYLQFIFRVTSLPEEGDKEIGYVYDFSPERVLKMSFESALHRAERLDEDDTREYLREYLECHPVWLARDGKAAGFKLIDIEEFIEEISNTDYASQQIKRVVDIDEDALESFISGIASLQVNEREEFNNFFLSRNGIKAKTYQITGNKKSEARQKEELEIAIENIKSILGYIPAFAAILGAGTVDNIIEGTSSEDWLDLAGVDKKSLELLLEEGIIKARDINRIIAPYGA